MRVALVIALLLASAGAAWAWQPRSVGIANGYVLAPGQGADPLPIPGAGIFDTSTFDNAIWGP